MVVTIGIINHILKELLENNPLSNKLWFVLSALDPITQEFVMTDSMSL